MLTIAPSVHRPGATQATAISVHFPRATHATAISVSTAFQNATGRGRPCAVPTSPWGRGSKEVQRLPFASLQNSPKLPKPSPAAPRRHSGRGRPFLQLSQVPEAVAASFYGRSRLPLASLRNSPNSRNPPLQLPGATQAAADLSCSSNKSLRPWQRLFMDVQGCRLPALKIPQTLPCSSQATQAAQTFPAAPTSPWGRGSVLLRRFKAAVCQPSKLSSPPLQLPGANQAAADLSCSSNKFLRPWQCSFTEVPGCRLPAFKTRRNSTNPPLQLAGAT